MDDVFGGGAAEAARYDLFSHSYACHECSVRDVPEVVVEVFWGLRKSALHILFIFPIRVCVYL
jgi:hypothetical protein